MQIRVRVKHSGIIYKKCGQVTACIDVFMDISMDLQNRYLLPGVTFFISFTFHLLSLLLLFPLRLHSSPDYVFFL